MRCARAPTLSFVSALFWVKRDYDITGLAEIRKGKYVWFHGIGASYRGEESAAHAHVRLVVFRHRGGLSVAGYQSMAAGAAGGVGAGAICGIGGVCIIWLPVV